MLMGVALATTRRCLVSTLTRGTQNTLPVLCQCRCNFSSCSKYSVTCFYRDLLFVNVIPGHEFGSPGFFYKYVSLSVEFIEAYQFLPAFEYWWKKRITLFNFNCCSFHGAGFKLLDCKIK